LQRAKKLVTVSPLGLKRELLMPSKKVVHPLAFVTYPHVHLPLFSEETSVLCWPPLLADGTAMARITRELLTGHHTGEMEWKRGTKYAATSFIAMGFRPAVHTTDCLRWLHKRQNVSYDDDADGHGRCIAVFTLGRVT
jgi:hypothetical protein